jgi:hypothetical protein
MTVPDDKTPAQAELDDALRSIREVGEDASGTTRTAPPADTEDGPEK